MSLGKKFGLLVAMPAVLIVAMAALGYFTVEQLQTDLLASATHAQKAQAVSTLLNNSNTLRAVHVSMLAAPHNETYLKKRSERAVEYTDKVKKDLATAAKLPWSPTGRALFDEGSVHLKKYLDAFPVAMEAAKTAKTDADPVAMEANVAEQRLAREAFEKLVKRQADNSIELSYNADDFGDKAQKAIFVVAAIATFGGMWMSRLILKQIRAGVSEIKKTTHGLATNNLVIRAEVNTADEIGAIAEDLNKAMQKIGHDILEIQGISEQAASATTELSATAEQLSSATTDISRSAGQQRQAMESSSSAMEEVSASIKEVADRLESAKRLAVESQRVTDAGLAAATETTDSMTKIKDSSSKVGRITAVIADIARQTNLLSLNAAIEAAKAGQQGKGFAVVAEEIRKLAERSATAVKEINTLIAESSERVDEGTVAADKILVSLKAIGENTKQRGEGVVAINLAITEQAKASEEVNESVSKTAMLTDRNASATTQLAASISETVRTIEDIANLSNKLRVLTQGFKV